MKTRKASVERITKETQIRGSLTIDGQGTYQISTGIRFFDHMLELFAKHGGFDLKLKATGDLDVDQHHTVEDVGIALGQLFAKALGDRKGDQSRGLFRAADGRNAGGGGGGSRRASGAGLSGSRASPAGGRSADRTGGRFLRRLRESRGRESAREGSLYGRSNHHKIEAIFKCFARAMRYACSTDERLKDQLPSTKGLL